MLKTELYIGTKNTSSIFPTLILDGVSSIKSKTVTF